MTNQLAINRVTENEYAMMRDQASALVKTGFLPSAIKTAEQALAIMLTGKELGIPPMAALNTINVIQGKPTVSPQLMLALIERSGQLQNIRFRWVEQSDDPMVCSIEVTMHRKGRDPHTETFGFEEAKAMGLLQKDNYRKQPGTMYKWRAVAAAARVVFPDVILGLYLPDEMGAVVNDEGEVVAIPEEPKEDVRGDLIAMCGNLFRELNSIGDEWKWNGDKIMTFINNRYQVTGGIQDLLIDDLHDLIDCLQGRKCLLLEAEGVLEVEVEG